jgi:hypothetical protein
MRKKLVLLILTATSIVAVAAHINFSVLDVQAEPFDAHQWRDRQEQAQQFDPGCVRGGMALALIQTDRLTNLSKRDVTELLGPSEGKTVDQFRYSLGQCHWNWEHSELLLSFNSNGLVERTTIQRQ